MRADSVLSALFLLAGWAATPAISQDAAAHESRNSHPVITAISVAERADSIAVEVTFSSELVKAEIATLEHPDRLVFDFPGCELAHPGQRQLVNRGSVLAVRTAAFSLAPLIARVVIDLKSPQDHEEVYAGNKLLIKLNLTGGDRRPAPATAESNPAASSPPPTPNPDRAAPKSAVAALAKPTTQPPSLAPREATVQLSAYTLLAQARALTISELEPLENKAQAGDLLSETTLGLAYHAGTLLKMDDAEALRLLQHAANHGFVAAEEAMGIFAQSGFGMAPDKARRAKHGYDSIHDARLKRFRLVLCHDGALVFNRRDRLPPEWGQLSEDQIRAQFEA